MSDEFVAKDEAEASPIFSILKEWVKNAQTYIKSTVLLSSIIYEHYPMSSSFRANEKLIKSTIRYSLDEDATLILEASDLLLYKKNKTTEEENLMKNNILHIISSMGLEPTLIILLLCYR
jgi:hypothetical protein